MQPLGAIDKSVLNDHGNVDLVDKVADLIVDVYYP